MRISASRRTGRSSSRSPGSTSPPGASSDRGSRRRSRPSWCSREFSGRTSTPRTGDARTVITMNPSVTVGQPGSPGVEPSRQAGSAPPLHRRLAGSPALRVVGRRLLVAVPVLWGVTFLTFLVLNALPGDAASALLGANATPQEVRAFSIKLHLNEPLLVRYGHWLGGATRGDLGTSLYYNQSVPSVLWQRLPVTLELVVDALLITLVCSVPPAVFSARLPRCVVGRTT